MEDRRGSKPSTKRVSMAGAPHKAVETSRPCAPSSSKDVTTQVRPRVPNCDLAMIAQNVAGQFCLLAKILHALHALRAESQAGFERVLCARAPAPPTPPPTTTPYPWSAQGSSPKLNDEARITGEEASSLGSAVERWSNADMKCPDTCPTCGTTVKILLAEIDELRRTRRFMLKVRQDANDILDEVVERALTHPRVKLYSM